MATQHQKDQHRKKMERERKARWRSKLPKKPPSDGHEEFNLEIHPVPVILPQKPLPPRLVKLEPEPVIPTMRPPDPLLFDPKGDPYRPAFWQEIDPNPKLVRLHVDPRAAYAYGQQLEVEQAAQQRQEQTEAAEAAKKALDTSVHAYWGDFA